MTARIRYHSISCQRFILIGFNVACVQIQNRLSHFATLRCFHSCSLRGLGQLTSQISWPIAGDLRNSGYFEYFSSWGGLLKSPITYIKAYSVNIIIMLNDCWIMNVYLYSNHYSQWPFRFLSSMCRLRYVSSTSSWKYSSNEYEQFWTAFHK